MENKSFAADIKKGLTAKKKFLRSKYIYDDRGSRLFQDIMQMPEYYLTDSEFEILSLQASDIFKTLQFSSPFNIIELGAGDGFKTFKLLEYLVLNDVKFNYIPIDISREAVNLLSQKLKKELPQLSIKPEIGDYFKVLERITTNNQEPGLLLFLGSNIGNYTNKEAIKLLQLLNKSMKTKDRLLIGIDLIKNPITIRQAYDDANKITKTFNLNLLVRINREFDADFILNDFDFYCQYNPENGKVKSYIVSLKEQVVNIKKLGLHIHFKQNELIKTELSKKYDLEEINRLAKKSGFNIVNHFLDCKHYFTDSLWKKS